MSKPQITEDTTIVPDLDYVAFTVASAAESVSIKVTDKKRDCEVLQEVITKDENGKEVTELLPFKNRSTFWGRSSKIVGGWLSENGFEDASREDFLIEDVYTPEPVENALHSAKMVVEGIKNHLGSDKILGVMGSGKNFRNDILLPEEYKANREDTHRPIHLEAVREYLSKKYPCHVITGQEADDWLNIFQFKGYVDWKNTGNLTYAVVAVDKDARGELGMLFNPTKKDREWLYPEPLWIDGIGELELVEKGKQKKIKGHGFKFVMYQILVGDSSDNYSPTKHAKIRFGDVKAYEVLGGKETPKELLEAVLTQYATWFPDGVKFTAFNGEEQDISSVEWANRMFKCAWMLRSLEDKTDLYYYLDKFGVEYD